MLRDLVKLRHGTWDDDLYLSILTRAKLLTSKRHLIAHGIWANREDGWYVELARGSWPKNLAELVAGSKKVTPELVSMDTSKLRKATNEIEALIQDLKRLRTSAVVSYPSSLKHVRNDFFDRIELPIARHIGVHARLDHGGRDFYFGRASPQFTEGGCGCYIWCCLLCQG
jgi:hypothetical protein